MYVIDVCIYVSVSTCLWAHIYMHMCVSLCIGLADVDARCISQSLSILCSEIVSLIEPRAC